MDLTPYFKSVLDQDRAPVVLCNLEHIVIYMNRLAGERYAKSGGMALVGKSIFDCHPPKANEMIRRVVAWFQESGSHNLIYTFRNDEENKDVYMVALRDESGALIGYYEKHEYRDRETMGLYEFEP